MLAKGFITKTKFKFFAFALLLFLNNSLFAQTNAGSIKGTVRSEKGQNVNGVSVNIVSNGKIVKTVETDSLGFFQFDGLDNTKTYDLSFVDINFESVKRENIKTGDTIDVDLRPNHANLDEVIVVGYGTQKKKDLTSAIAEVTEKDFNSSGARNAMDLIQGKVAGLSITRTAGTNPNSSPSIQLRGVASINGTNSPLIVIDGVPGGNLDLLQQSDIESMTVLKDGSAAAIYGTRANGGVILVTTKKAGKGKAQYNYSGYVRKEALYRHPKVMDAAMYRQKISEGVIGEKQDMGSSTDWFNELVNHGNVSHYHNLSMSGGTANTSYRASLYFSNMDGIAKQNTRQQYGATLAIVNNGFNNRLRTEINAMINNNKANLLGGGGWTDALFNSNPTQSPYDSSNAASGGYWYVQNSPNVVADLNQKKSLRDQQTSLVQFNSTLTISKDLSASLQGSVQRNQYVDNQFNNLESHSSLADGDYPGGGYAYKGTFLANDYLISPTVNYQSSFSTNHNLSAVVGYTYQNHLEESFSASNKGFSNNEVGENDLNSGIALANGKASMSSNKLGNKLVAFFGRVNYSYKGKYLAQFVLRHEGSTRFGDNNKWGNFPAVSLGWTINQEEFMKNVSWINNLKLRAGFGETGNQDFTNGISVVTLGTGGYYLFPDGSWKQTYGPDKNANPNLKWETKKEFNFGLDFSLFNYGLTGSVNYFIRNTSNLVADVTAQQPANANDNTWENIGSLRNRGFEIQLGTDPIRTSNFDWHIDVTGSHAISTLTQYSLGSYLYGGNIGNPGNLGNSERIGQGDQIGTFYGLKHAGFDDAGKFLVYNKAGQAISTTDAVDDDKTKIGNAMPKYFASMTHSFTYKNFSLRMMFRGQFGYKILNTMDMLYGNQTSLPNNVLLRAFSTYNNIHDGYFYDSYYLQNGNFVKLDQLTFSYKIPMKENNYIRNIDVYVTGSNLWLITGYKGNDPDEVANTGLFPGVDATGVYPSTRSFLLGVNIGF
ncbi:SusC/RagA family TonB-linked outer membrane protein [Rhizosphaericola mali]|uniref:SusC/RagA family TonB-linked outer membrane protein n=1 Tax=Rhizosphaericola mali TaxID=2545455 RepID=A0A5P2FZZ1_9BACT|nr:SusC/RagA family TonB-linked outer membrane protein [Rhizosphaericola mali]QES87132.1 SusC/RagA family TonB-linked outer membrane protein [Rhizosphaericola mali]